MRNTQTVEGMNGLKLFVSVERHLRDAPEAVANDDTVGDCSVYLEQLPLNGLPFLLSFAQDRKKNFFSLFVVVCYVQLVSRRVKF